MLSSNPGAGTKAGGGGGGLLALFPFPPLPPAEVLEDDEVLDEDDKLCLVKYGGGGVLLGIPPPTAFCRFGVKSVIKKEKKLPQIIKFYEENLNYDDYILNKYILQEKQGS